MSAELEAIVNKYYDDQVDEHAYTSRKNMLAAVTDAYEWGRLEPRPEAGAFIEWMRETAPIVFKCYWDQFQVGKAK